MKQRSSLMASAAAFMLMMAMSITTAILGFFITPVSEELGVGRASFTFYVSLMTVSAALFTPTLGQYVNRKGVKTVVLISGLWCSAAFMVFSFANSLWVFYVTGILMGMFATNCMNICANVIVQQTFSEGKASGVLGIVMSGSGVGGMILSLVIPNVISLYGWRVGYRALALCWAVLVLGAYFLLGNQKTSGNVSQRSIASDGMTRAEALRSPMLYLLIIAMVTMTASSSIQQQLPSVLSGMNFTTAEVSVMISMMTACLAIGKIVQGLLYSKIGMAKGSVIMMFLFGISYVLLLNRVTAYPGLIALAFGLGTITTLLPTMTRVILGSREYPAIWGIVTTSSSVAGIVSGPLWGATYDATGSYRLAMIVSPVLVAIALVAMLVAFRKAKK